MWIPMNRDELVWTIKDKLGKDNTDDSEGFHMNSNELRWTLKDQLGHEDKKQKCSKTGTSIPLILKMKS